MTATKPTDGEIAAVRDLLTRAATAHAKAPKTAMIELVTMPEFGPLARRGAQAQTSNPR